MANKAPLLGTYAIIVNIIGGLGNQMFQYAFAYAFSKTNNTIVKLDMTDFQHCNYREYGLGLFNTNIALASERELDKYKKKNFLQKLRNKILLSSKYYQEPHFDFDEKALRAEGDAYFRGYWQSEKYFNAYRNELLEQFTLKKEISPETLKYKQHITKTESISLHVRRGDYVAHVKTNRTHGVCGLDYYKSAVLKIKQQTDAPLFFIFSDDIIWAKENLSFIDNIIFIELEETTPDHEEMYLMSLCKHNIIANSSFSWWGAWLNQNLDKIIIAPKKWFNDISLNTKDITPTDWIRL